MALAVAVAGMVADSAAAATPTTLYVDNTQGSNCSDSGQGTSAAAPFCTISKAASVVQPGQTVMVGYGGYPEEVNISAKGTAAKPITFIGQSSYQDPWATLVGTDGAAARTTHAIVLDGAQNVVIKGFSLAGQDGAIQVEDSQNVTVDQVDVLDVGQTSGTAPDFQVSGASSGVTLSRSTLLYGVQIGAGATGTTITTNDLLGSVFTNNVGYAPVIQATDATGTVAVSNTITEPCAAGVGLEGASTGSTIENNIITDAGFCLPSTGTSITVASGSTTGTTSDYNIVKADGSAVLYSWGGATYSTAASFTTATGQGAHDLNTDPELVIPASATGSVPGFDAYYPTEGSPEINSANASAPGEMTADIDGLARVDDPLVPNTGTGSGDYDRGAFQFQDPIAVATPTVTNTPGQGPQAVTVTTGVTGAWSKNVTYTYSFGDGTPNVVTAAATAQHIYAGAGYQNIQITAADGYASSGASPNVILGADYTPMTPVRMLDTRSAIGVPTTTPVPANSTVTLTVGGVDGIPATGVSAVIMNVTATNPTSSGFITAYPHGQPMPNSSNVNFVAGETVPNLVAIQVQDGKIDFHNSGSGTVNIVADAEGYYSNAGYGFKAITPVRVLDTRAPIGVPSKAPVAAGGLVQLDLSSQIPAGTKAVTMNVTVTNPTANGVITAYPYGATRPNASNVNYTPHETVPNLVTVPVNNGKVDFYNGSTGTVDLVADLAGYYGDSTTDATSAYVPYLPTRIWDTRTFGVTPAPIGANGTLSLANALANYGNVPADATAAVMNVTVTNPTANGVITLYPDGSPVPNASNLNYTPHETVPNLVTVAIGPNDGVDALNSGTGSTDLVVDLEGYFVPPLS